ncbi:MAG: squalene/phytoene synthase family protein, partial [Rhodanobacteraceae bacterium]
MSDSALESYLSSWREADPQRTCTWLFLRRAERIRYGALAAMLHEWWKVVHDVREPAVAVAKLGWWREELQHAAEGEARHPLTQSLFVDPRVREVPLSYWTAVVDAAMLAVAVPPPADFTAQRSTVAPLANATAELESCVWFGRRPESSRAAEVTAVANLVVDTRALPAEVGHGRSPLPMSLLARHGLTIEQLAADTPS